MDIKSKISDIEYYLFCLLPVRKKIVFLNFWGRGYGDSPKYIAEEIIRQGLNYEMIWLVHHFDNEMPARIKQVKYYSLKSKIELATAHVIISNVKGGLPFKKKKKQYYIQTWHGGFGVKFIEKEIEHFLTAKYVKSSKHDSSITDLILSGSEFQTKVIKDAFWYDGEIFKKGVPRNDIFFNITEEIVYNLRKKYGFQKTDKIAIYAPTFRDDNSSEAYCLDTAMLLQALEERTGFQWKLIIRLHPVAANYHSLFNYDQQVIDGSSFSDSQELLVMSDLLITDFSSVMMDFGIMKKPVFLFITDLEQYIQHCRDIRPIFYQLPFVLSRSNEELRLAVLSYEEHEYLNRLNRFMSEFFQSYDDGHASQHVVDRIKEIMER